MSFKLDMQANQAENKSYAYILKPFIWKFQQEK